MRELILFAAFACTTHAFAQDSVKPELLLILDSSHHMERLAGGEAYPVCSPSTASGPEEGIAYSQNRMSAVQDALCGSRSVSWCMEASRSDHLLGEDSGIPHYRPMCCKDADCSDWIPCGADTGKNAASGDTVAALGTGFANDGFIYTHRSDIRFSLMTLDSEPGPNAAAQANGQSGHYSYGSTVSVASSVASGAFDDRDKGVTSVNLGIRNASASSGALIAHNKGLLGDSGAASSSVSESQADVESHNLYVMNEIRRIVPFGRAALSPMLSDALTYVDEIKSSDSMSSRPRAAVFITQATPDWYFDQAGCNGCAADQCVQIPNPLGGDSLPVCRAGHQEGFPYSESSFYAKKLRQAGVPLYVIAVGPGSEGESFCQSLAEQGSPGLGYDGQAGCYVAQDVASVKEALEKVANSFTSGVRSQTRSLIIIPGAGDDEGSDDIRQWRFEPYTVIPEAGDSGRYGHIEQHRLGCDATRVDPDAPGALVAFPSRKFEQLLEKQSVRRVVSETAQITGYTVSTLAEGLPLSVMGASASLFNQEDGAGTLLAASYVQALTHLTGTALAQMVMTLNGYFGEEGRPEGTLPGASLRRRQLGAVLGGEMVAIPPPVIGAETAAVQLYEQQKAKRPTLVAQGAQDGLVHFFRADTGIELFSFLPQNALTQYGSGFNAEGLMDARPLALCRSLGEHGSLDCPAGVSNTPLRTFVSGAVSESQNLYALQLDGLGATADAFNNIASGNWNPLLYFPKNAIWNVTQADESKLGRTVSRPVLTHVRVDNQIKAAVVAGCGQDTDELRAKQDDIHAVGRCVLVLDASDGSVIRRFENMEQMTRPMVGSPAIWPGDALAAAEQVYMGDAVGRLWRFDLTAIDPDDWTGEIIWPDLGATYKAGRALAERPSLIENDAGDKVIVFGTGSEGDGSLNQSYVVSLTERSRLNSTSGAMTTLVSENWTFPLADGEALVGSTVVREGVAYFTTAQLVEDSGSASTVGRLFGVDAERVYTNSEGTPITYQRYDKTVNVLPRLTLAGSSYNALSVILPEGRLAYGVSLVSTPSCTDGDEVSTDIILNLGDQSQGATGAVNASALQVEQVGSTGVQSEALGGRMYAAGGSRELTLSTDRDANGKVIDRASGPLGPFPSATTYWGSALSE